jgi:C_GCAxxG_C_C family probable redox protein
MAESESVKERAYNYERRYHGCSQCPLLALQEFLGLEDELTFKAASSLCGGLAFSGNTCGALSAGVMVLGMKYGRANIEEGLAGLVKGMLPAYRLVKWFEGEFGTTLCREISGLQMDEEILKAMAAAPEAMEAALPTELIEKCSQIVGKTAEKVAEIISEEG